MTAEWDAFGEIISEKLTLRQRAALLKENIPAVFLALGHKDTPAMAKISAGLALAYALSPIDLIPDFIPVLGYLDDVLILSGLIAIAVKLIPAEVLRECRIRAAKESLRPQKRWYYSLPIIMIWLLIIGLIVIAII
ncbi:MAG: YkvA family protein [Oscillospiraceae bacterium]|nr:YkvA family protein [Oscillospiraceae bacterium]